MRIPTVRVQTDITMYQVRRYHAQHSIRILPKVIIRNMYFTRGLIFLVWAHFISARAFKDTVVKSNSIIIEPCNGRFR